MKWGESHLPLTLHGAALLQDSGNSLTWQEPPAHFPEAVGRSGGPTRPGRAEMTTWDPRHF